MPGLVDDLRAWWLSVGPIAALIGDSRAHYLHVPQGYDGTYLWYARAISGDDADRCLDDAPGRDVDFTEGFNVEAVARTLAEAEQLALQLRKLDSWAKWDGPIGAGTAQAVFVTDHSDDYTPQGAGHDSGLAVAALRFEIIGYQPGS